MGITMKTSLIAAVAAVTLGMSGAALAGTPLFPHHQQLAGNNVVLPSQRPTYLAGSNNVLIPAQRPTYLAGNNVVLPAQRPAYLA